MTSTARTTSSSGPNPPASARSSKGSPTRPTTTSSGSSGARRSSTGCTSSWGARGAAARRTPRSVGCRSPCRCRPAGDRTPAARTRARWCRVRRPLRRRAGSRPASMSVAPIAPSLLCGLAMPRPPAASVPEPALLLSATQVRALNDPATLLEELRRAMRAYATADQPRGRRTHSQIPSRQPHSVMIVFPGLVPGIPAYTVKINAKLPESVPSVRGLIALHDLETGALLAVMDSIAITAIRTGLVGGLAADALARTSIDTVAMIGAGTQGREQLRALRLVRSFSRVRVYDTTRSRAEELARELADLGASFTIAPSVAEAVRDADVVVTATWAKQPILTRDMIAPGTHITAIGADEPGKAELDRALIAVSKFVC